MVTPASTSAATTAAARLVRLGSAARQTRRALSSSSRHGRAQVSAGKSHSNSNERCETLSRPVGTAVLQARQVRVSKSSSMGTMGSMMAMRSFSTTPRRAMAEEAEDFDLSALERVEDECDVCIVGGGPAGLSAAIKLKQLALDQGKEIRVVVLEKGGEPGAHILSGAVIETKALDELLPDWHERGAPLHQPALSDSMKWLTPSSAFPMPHPPQMSNKGNYIVSLSRVTRWLAEQAEELGVEVYAGFAAAQLVYSDDGKSVKGVITNEVGLDKDFKPKDTFEPGMAFKAKVTLVAEGAHGSLSKQLIRKFNLRDGKDPQTYGLGVKEVWRVTDDKYKPGSVLHTLGWPLDNRTYGGSFCYHMEDNLVQLGLVVGLDYQNPYLSPFREFQRLKHHPLFADMLAGGECVAYGARVLNEGGYQSVPKLSFPGGALIGCSAGFLNVPKIKGTHNAMKSGMLAAEAAANALKDVEPDMPADDVNVDMTEYERLYEDSWIAKELYEIRNLRPSFHNPLGNLGGIMYSGLDSLILKGRTPWTLHHPKEDYEATEKASQHKPIDYPKPDGVLSFDILTSVSRTGTNHTENQPVHLHVEAAERPHHVDVNVGEYASLLEKACPAAVYEYVDAEGGADADARGKRLVINSQNCIHCKTCSVKTPTQDIEWRVPEGGGGPKYSIT